VDSLGNSQKMMPMDIHDEVLNLPLVDVEVKRQSLKW
jgi:hypothetical protein